MSERIEALDIVALALDEIEKRGTPQHIDALRLLAQAKEIWRDQLSKKKCSNCGHEL